MSYSNDFIINVNKNNVDDILLVLVEIDHPFLAEPARLINDNQDFIFQGNTFLQMPFTFERQPDVQGQLPVALLRISNVGRTLTKWIDSTGGGRNAILKVMLARRSAPSVLEEQLDFGIESVNIDMQYVTFNLVIQNNLIKRAVKATYDLKKAVSLF